MLSALLRTAVTIAAFTAANVLLSAAQAAESVADFYKGQELTILIGHPPGGSYDLYAQLAAAHLGKFIPGRPTAIVQSMPGGAASKATAYFYNKAPRDGSVIALFPETIAYVQLMDPIQGKWDVTRMRYIGSLAPVNTVFMIRVPYDGTAGVTPWMAGGGGTVRSVSEKNSLEPFLSTEANGERVQRN